MVAADRKRWTNQCQHECRNQSKFHSSISLPPSTAITSPNNLHEPVLAVSRVRRYVSSGELGDCAGVDSKHLSDRFQVSAYYLPVSADFLGSETKASEEMRNAFVVIPLLFLLAPRCRSADVRLLKSRDCVRRKCGLRAGVPGARQQKNLVLGKILAQRVGGHKPLAALKT